MQMRARSSRLRQLAAGLGSLALSAASLGHRAEAASGPEAGWQPRQDGYVVETVAGGLRLPVDIAFIPHPGSDPDSPWFYVTELSGNIKVVARDGDVSTYATGLLNFAPRSGFPGAGEVGLAGIVVEPATGDVLVSLAYQDGGALHPEVLRLHSTDGGATAASQSVILQMPALALTTSHMASSLSFGPDGKLYVHVGDAGSPLLAQNLDSFGGKILRMNADGTPASDNPFFDASDGITARDYVFASGLRNPFGGDWRAADGQHYSVENGPTVDRFARVLSGESFGYDGSDASMAIGACYTWSPAHAPVNLAFVQASTFSGSGFPIDKRDHAFVSEFGSYWVNGPLANGKRISEFTLDGNAQLVSGPVPLVEYVGTGKATAVGLAAGSDGLYFTDFFADSGSRFDDAGAHVMRVRYVGTTAALPTVGIIADPAVARERHLRPGILVVTRTGDTSASLPVAYTVGGTAQPGVEYVPLSGTVVIPAGATSASIDVMPIQDTIAYGNQSVVVTVSAGSGVAVGTPASATVLLRDDDRITRAQIAIDQATRFQTITGIGGNFANGRFTGSAQPNDSVGAATLAQLSPSHARIGIPLKGWAPVAVDPAAPDLGYSDAGDVHNVFLLLQDLQRRHIPIIASIWDAPDWMVTDPSAVTARSLAPGMEVPFTAAITAFLLHAHDLYGIDIQAVSLNEADGGFNLLVPSSQVAPLAVRAVLGFRARGLTTGWVAGDATSIASDVPYAAPALDDAQARPLLLALGLHTWDAEARPDAAFAGAASLAASHGLPVWATEIGYDAQVYRTNPGTFSTWDNAWRLALVTQRTLSVGQASVLDFWSYQNDFPLADPATGRLYPSGVVVKQLADRLTPGMHLVAATPTVPVLQAFAAADEGRNTFMTQIINTSARPARVRITGLPDRNLALVRTSQTASLLDLGGRRPHAGQLTLTLPAQSISSLSGSLHAGPADLPPVVDAGPTQSLALTLPIVLNGTIHDDGLPAGSTLSVAWTADSGPGPVQFTNAAQAATTATVTVPGLYRLRLTASDGILSTSATVLISVLGQELHVNFQPAGIPAPAGYLPDSGQPFADQGNGFQYGWATSTATAFARASAASPDQRYDTGVPTPAGALWEIAVPNGDYLVHVVAGDATNSIASEQVFCEGVSALAGTLTGSRHWVESTTRVTVADGRLSVVAGPGAIGASLAFVDIAPAPVLPPLVAFTDPSSAIPENAGSAALIAVDLTHAYPLPVTIAYQVTGGSAVAGTNYVLLPAGTLTFAPGSTHQTIALTPLDDHIHTLDTSVTLALGAPANATLGATTIATVTIVDTDPLPVVAFQLGAIQALETAGTIALPVTLSTASGLPVTVAYAVTAGSAQAGVNFAPLAAGQLTIPPGSPSVVLPVTLLDDHLHDPDLTLVVTLSQPVGATLGATASTVLTIHDADPLPVLAFSQATVAAEQTAGTIALPLSLNGPSGVPATAMVVVAGGNAVAGTDFILPSANVVLAPGATSTSLPLTILASGAADDRTLTLQLTGLQDATAGAQATLTITIHGTGRPAVVSFGAAAAQGDDAVTSVSVQVILDQARPSPLVVPFHVAGGSAINGAATDPTTDYTLSTGTVTVPAGETSAMIPITVVNRTIPEFAKTIVLQLDASPGVTLGSQATFLYTITNDDLPSPSVQFTQGVTAGGDALGFVPDGYGITHLLVSASASFTAVRGEITANGGFDAHVENSSAGSQQSTLTLNFADDSGHISPATTATITFGDSTGKPVITGDSSNLPAGIPKVTLRVSSGLTGDRTGQLNGESVFFTNNSGGPVVLSVSAVAIPGAITATQVLSDDGSIYDVTNGIVPLGALAEGRHSFTAQAIATNGNSIAKGTTQVPVVLIVDTKPPLLAFTIPQRYRTRGSDPLANPLTFPLRTTTTNVQDLILLNANSDETNIPLRDKRHMNVYDAAGFTAEATVIDDSGISSATDQASVTASPSSSAFTVQSTEPSSDGSAQTLTITGFSGLEDSVQYDPNTLALLTQKGRYALHVHLRDRAGNTLESDQFKMWVKREKPSAQVGAFLSSQYGDFVNRYTSLGAYVEISPARWVVSTPDAAVVWQDSVDDAQILPRELSGPNNPDSTGLGVPSVSGWRLLKPVEIPGSGAGKVTVIVEDFLGNRSAPISRDMNRKRLDVRYHGPPNGHGGKDYIFDTSGYGNNASASERPIFDKLFPPTQDAYRFIIGKSSDVTLAEIELQLLGNFRDGIRDGWLDYTTDPNDYWNGARVNNVELIDSPDGVVQYTSLLVNPIDVGVDPQISVAPAVISVPPSWQTQTNSIPIQVQDHGIIAIGANPTQKTMVVESVHPDSHASVQFLTPSMVTVSGQPALRGTLPLSRSIVDPLISQVPGQPARMVDAIDPGFTRLIYGTSSLFTYPAKAYNSRAGFRWLNFVKLSPDVLLAGTTMTVRIEAGFLNDTLTINNFNPKGDYVHFLGNGVDITQPASSYDPQADPLTRSGKIAIVAQRLVVEGKNGSLVQALELDLDIARDAPAQICDIDIKLGAVYFHSPTPGFESPSPENPDPYKGENGAHRMSKTLSVTVWDSRIVYIDEETGKTESSNDYTPTVDLPYPNIDLTVVSATISTDDSGNQNGIDISYDVTITDPSSDYAIEGKQIQSVKITANDIILGNIPLLYNPGNALKPRSLDYNHSGSVHFDSVPYDNVFFQIEATNAAGYRGYSTWNIPIMTDYSRTQPSGAHYRYLLEPVESTRTPLGTLRVYYPVTIYKDANFPNPNHVIINGTDYAPTKKPISQLLENEGP